MADIAIMVIDPSDNRTAQLVDENLPVRTLIPILVGRIGLPAELSYQLIPAGARQGLLIDYSLAASGTRAAAQLYLVPVRDGVFAAVLDRLYAEARDYAARKLWELARERLDQIFRTYPEYPDVARLLDLVAPHAISQVLPGGAATSSGATAAHGATGAAASGGGGALAVLFVLVVGGVAAYANRVEIEKWWNQNRPAWAKQTAATGTGTPGKTGTNGKTATDAALDPYGIFLVGPGEEVICGRRSAIENTPKGHLHGWGLDTKTTVGQSGVQLKMIRGPFATAEETRKAYDAELMKETIRDMGISNHTRARFRFDSKEHMIDNATRLLR